jgi:hypothetical protein
MLLGSIAAQAGVVLYDGFDYTLGEHLAGQQSPGSGWNGPWNVDAPLTSDWIVPGLTFPGPQYQLVVSGNAVTLSTLSQVDSSASRRIGVSLTSGDLWTSWLVNIDAEIAGDRVVETRVNAGEFGNYLSSKFRTLPKTWNETAAGVGYDYAETKGGPPGSTQRDVTYLVVSRFQDLGQDSGGVATLWLISPTDFAAMDLTGGGMSLADLNGHYSCRVSDGHANESLNANDFVQLTLFSDVTATYDELRHGTALEDVVPLVVPEPTTLAALTLLGLVLRRTR